MRLSPQLLVLFLILMIAAAASNKASVFHSTSVFKIYFVKCIYVKFENNTLSSFWQPHLLNFASNKLNDEGASKVSFFVPTAILVDAKSPFFGVQST